MSHPCDPALAPWSWHCWCTVRWSRPALGTECLHSEQGRGKVCTSLALLRNYLFTRQENQIRGGRPSWFAWQWSWPEVQDYFLNITQELLSITKRWSNYRIMPSSHSFTRVQSSISSDSRLTVISYCSLFSSAAAELRQFAGGGDLRGGAQREDCLFEKSSQVFSP